MQDSFVSFENLNTINHSSAWIPRVFSHLRRKSESIPTDIDSSGLHMLTSFAPWGSTPTDMNMESRTLAGRSDICRKKSNSADPIIIDNSCIDEIPETFLQRSSSQKSVHSRSVSLPTTFKDYLPDFLNNFMSTHPEDLENNSNKHIFKLGNSHSIYFEGTGIKMYTVYIIEMELIKSDSSNQTFKIKKRFSEFKDLHDNLIKIYGVKLPSFPKKSLLGKFGSLND